MATKTAEAEDQEQAPAETQDGPVLDMSDAAVKKLIKTAKDWIKTGGKAQAAWDADGFKLPDEMEARIEELIVSNEIAHLRPTADAIGKAYRIDDAEGRYIEFVKRSLPKELDFQGMKVVVDCANGAAYKVAPTVLRELGAKVEVIANKPDGMNINAGLRMRELGNNARN